MPDDNPTASTSSSAGPRPKPSRSSTTTGTVRGRTSPSGEQNSDGRPPTKRARKAINCEPCRNSKLKCDRNRPCSSCVLRGTSAMCYQDARGHDGNDALTRGDDHHHARIDPAQEIIRLRHSISLLEAYIFPATRNHIPPPRRPSDASSLIPKKEAIDPDVSDKTSAAPGMLGTQTQGGLYAGPTSAATHLLMNEPRSSEDSDSRQHSQEHTEEFPVMTPEYDRDLLGMLPPIEVIDELIAFYFEYCNWIYRHVNQTSFTHQWERFKNGSSSDRIVLATACAMIAVATFYLPANHPLLDGFTETHEEIGQKFYEVSSDALARRWKDSRAYSIELVELHLIRGLHQTLWKNDSEEIWHIKGELVTIAMAMGLHRDPGKWRMHRDVAERRRWAWWHIVLMERWQAFMFGRPLAIASHHFDTQLPSYCDPAIDKTGRLYLPNIALFRLAFILGDIMDDAVSVRPVPYESVLANDRALTQWMEELPSELDLDEFRVARSLASPNTAVRRIGVQSVIIRTSYYHLRFSLHRPYASSSPSAGLSNGKPNTSEPLKTAQSLEIAVSAADKLITMVGQARPEIQANSSLAVPGHMSWGPWHCFSAGMFFSFQLIANPDQPGAGLFRASIRKAISTLEQSRGNAVADKGYDILTALSPLYAPEFPASSPESREKQRQQVLGTVRKLAFPYHDSHDPRRFAGDSPSGRGGASSPSNSTSVSPPLTSMSALPPPPQYESMHSLSSLRTAPPGGYSHHQSQSGHSQTLSQSPTQLQMSPTVLTHITSSPISGYTQGYPINQQHQMYPDSSRYAQYVHPADESTMWGAAVGFGQGEWTQFLDGLRPETGPGRHNHLQGSS
ncbi:putative transcriptional regulatory protein C1F7.11c [Hypsizygus marmoreus]|uniref:Transcriptional regulatory protein C1F7.11c n=1 Tax=Hypsizygus marmoreus TaxID=39966 RepID=A0A369JEI2_HYPMA|nr:putative transcriptional regulatory protein C1F7.11c [Hypsizygus marmoreus]